MGYKFILLGLFPGRFYFEIYLKLIFVIAHHIQDKALNQRCYSKKGMWDRGVGSKVRIVSTGICLDVFIYWVFLFSSTSKISKMSQYPMLLLRKRTEGSQETWKQYEAIL